MSGNVKHYLVVAAVAVVGVAIVLRIPKVGSMIFPTVVNGTNKIVTAA